MRASVALFALAPAFLAGSGLAEGGPKPKDVAAFVAALKAQGCYLTPENAPQVIDDSGVPAELAAAVSQRLQDEGKLTVGNDMNLTLVPELCQ